jgi:hypothetical protein
MTNHPEFPSPTPALSGIAAAIAALAAARRAAQTGVQGAATPRNDKKAALVALVQQLRTYARTVADADHGGSANVIESAGFVVKKTTRGARMVQPWCVGHSRPRND